jgi:hypothetical protein
VKASRHETSPAPEQEIWAVAREPVFDQATIQHDARLSDWDVLQGYERQIRVMRQTEYDHKRWPEEAVRFGRAAVGAAHAAAATAGSRGLAGAAPEWPNEEQEQRKAERAKLVMDEFWSQMIPRKKRSD